MTSAHSNGTSNVTYLLIKANALQIPLRNNSAGLVIATPPFLGSKRFGKAGFCVSDPREYHELLGTAFTECVRILEPQGHILQLVERETSNGSKVFDVFQKRFRGGSWGCDQIGLESISARYVYVEGFNWQALSVSLYRLLIDRYSPPGKYVVHVFSGSGNSGIAALQLARTVILIDLHYHRQTRERLNRRLPLPK